jgi:LuxR family transcriptional regulator, maltose regulon positive regulatory protein
MQFLKTKFYQPGVNQPSVILRDQLLTRLCSDQNSQIVVVSAPAGFGKTTLLSCWLNSIETKAAWLSLDKYDSNLNGFWSYFIGSVMTVLPETGKTTLGLINSDTPSPIESNLISLINEFSDIKERITIVLDDYHLISEPKIHESLEFFLDHIPPNFQLVIASREDPNLSLSRFRVSGKLLEIRQKDLRFTNIETEDLLNKVYKLDLSKNACASLYQKTEGWIAGLMLAILSLKEDRNKERFITEFTGSHRFILDYLVDEVLSGLPEDIRDFMLKISVMEKFCPDVCQAVTKNPETLKHLKYIKANNLFLIPLDHQGNWFRYHHLFREFLLKHLLEKKKDDITNLHSKAFFWFKENGDIQQALNHSIKAKQFDRAARLLSQKAPELLDGYQDYLFIHFINQLPEEVAHGNATLLAYKVWINIMAGNFEYASLLVPENFKNEEKNIIKGIQLAIEAYMLFYQAGDFKTCIKTCETVLNLLDAKHQAMWNMIQFMNIIAYRYHGDAKKTKECLKNKPHQSNDDFYIMNQADFEIEMGCLNTALEKLDRLIENTERIYGDSPPVILSFTYITKAKILREKGRLDAAQTLSQKGLNLAKNGEYMEAILLGNLEHSLVLGSQKKYEAAFNTLNKGIEIAQVTQSWTAQLGIAYKMKFHIMKKEFEPVHAWVITCGFSLNDEPPFHLWLCYLTLIRYYIHTGKPQKVYPLLDKIIVHNISSNRYGSLLECYILKSLALYIENQKIDALKILKKGFKIAEPEGYEQMFVDEGESMIALLAYAKKKQSLPEYLCKYLSPLDNKPISQNKTAMIHEFKETFNDREIDILQLMKQGESNKNIANTLFLSVNTVRWYASRIFSKLDVKRRGEAVVYAQKYGLL